MNGSDSFPVQRDLKRSSRARRLHVITDFRPLEILSFNRPRRMFCDLMRRQKLLSDHCSYDSHPPRGQSID